MRAIAVADEVDATRHLHAVIIPAVPTGQVASRRMRALGKGAQRLPEQVVDAQGHVAAPDGRLLGNAERDDDGGVEGFG